MEKKFKALRFIGTVWKVLAWITLIIGVLSSVGMLLASIFGGGVLSQFGQQYGEMPWVSWVFGLTGGIVAFGVSLIFTIIYFLLLYAVGEFIYLLLAIEENTRLTVQWIQSPPAAPAAYPATPAAYSPLPLSTPEP